MTASRLMQSDSSTEPGSNSEPDLPVTDRIGELEREVDELRVRLASARSQLKLADEMVSQATGTSPRTLDIARRLTGLGRRTQSLRGGLTRLLRGELNPLRRDLGYRRIAIVSTPRTGNTWLRLMLSRAYALEQGGSSHIQEVPWGLLPSRSVVQIHARRNPETVACFRKYRERVVVLSRHPLDVLMSILVFARRDNMTREWLTGEGGDEWPITGVSPNSRAFLDYALGPRAAALLAVSKEWWEDPDALSVRYETLKAETVSEVRRIGEWVGLEPGMPLEQLPAMFSKDRMKSNEVMRSHHVWQAGSNQWRRMLTADRAMAIYERHREVFETLGYTCEPDPELETEQAEQNWQASIRTA